MKTITESGLDIGNGDSKRVFTVSVNGKIFGFITEDDINFEDIIHSYEKEPRMFIPEYDPDDAGMTRTITGLIEAGPEWDVFMKFIDEENEKTRIADMGRKLIAQAFKDIQYLRQKSKLWDEERTHINPYSKKQKKMNCGGKTLNKGRSSAQYFSLRSTRKQNTSSVK